ncbi:hypothetical protein R1sor_004958 [Riccia sorocarpa]|uniref:Reverse transcriptase domain-containing protein n=1 Tax=Riccia sorocarpa TaxID=122646 RepID=A0ABD3HIG3_9MARC
MIIELIEGTYKALYTANPEEAGIQRLREESLALIDRKFSVEQNGKLKELPSDELIEDVVRSLPGDKTSGIDGVTAEVLVAGWSFMKQDCINRIQWNWRPISLLTNTYKIIAKIFAWRLRGMLEDVIDQQQMGFTASRSITENILSLRLAQDWVMETGQDIMFIKLDFQKVYDRVSHEYLWATVTALGVDAENLKRIQDMVKGGTSHVQINGNLSESFMIDRGVRQGCPLASCFSQ